ncbi:MAG: His/Gly/Thr/Pro-type tRNA ligase C-terminal domain-containing protein, partial [Candidatus Thalassarchaeaceae archaeon]
DSDGNTRPCHQTTFGMSERLLGAVVGMHGDDKGLIFPPSIAPFQVVIMPVASHIDENVIPAAENIFNELLSLGIRAKLDSRDVRPGVKHYDWEIKGVPIRVELGPRDISSGKCISIMRTGGKSELNLVDAPQRIVEMLEELSDELRARASSMNSDLVRPFPLERISEGQDLDSIVDDGIVYEIAFNGNDSDAEFLEKKLGLTLLGECDESFDKERKCIVTGKSTFNRCFIARMY